MARRTKQTPPRAKAEPADSVRLTDKQRMFVAEYLKCWNASEAARRAGYSEKTARVIGPENLSKPAIRAAIEERMKLLSMSADEALARLSEMARADMSDFVDPDTNDIDLARAQGAGKLHLLKKLTHTVSSERETVSIELHDAQSALVQILNQWRQVSGDAAKLDVTVNGSIPLTIRVVEEDMPPMPSNDAGAEG